MEPTDLTIEILKDIRAGIGQLDQRLTTRIDATNERLEQLDERLGARIDGTNARIDSLTRRVVESEIRTSTAIADLAGTIRTMTDVLRASHDLRPRVERCELDIIDLKHRLP